MNILNKLILDINENDVRALHIDGSSLYVGTRTNPPRLIKIDIPTFSKVASIVFESGVSNIESITTDANYIYAITYINRVYKIDKTLFAWVDTVIFNAGESGLMPSLIYNGYLYIGMNTQPAKVGRINLTSFTRDSVITLDSTESSIQGQMQIYKGILYVPIYDANLVGQNTKVVKIDPVTFTKIGTITLPDVDNNIKATYLNSNYLWCGFDKLFGAPDIVRINLDNETYDKITLNDHLISSIEKIGLYIYVIAYDTLKVIQIDETSLSQISSLSIDPLDGIPYHLESDGIYLYLGTKSYPATILKIETETCNIPICDFNISGV